MNYSSKLLMNIKHLYITTASRINATYMQVNSLQ